MPSRRSPVANATKAGAPPPDPHARLFQAKLKPPLDAARVLQRSGLPGAEAIGQGRLALFTAPAGFGKTTALCQYERALREAGIATAWITLDAEDNDLARFTAYLRAALRRCVPGDGAASGSESGVPGAALGDAFELVDSVAASDKPFALFLDEFEKLRDADAMRVISRLLMTLGPRQQLVLGSRAIPELGLARLRASGQLLEVDLDRLRFDAEETRRFLLELRGCRMAPDDVAFLHQRSEGWPAALQLAALAVGDHPEGARRLRAFGGSLAQVADYLAEEVLARLPADLRGFVLRTSILESFNAELCEEVTGVPGSAALIDRVAAASLFLQALDADRRWFRYHTLFAEFLRSRLEREDAAALPELHRRAAGWLARHDRHAAAVDHALRSGDVELAARIMDEGSTAYLHEGHVATLVRWCGAIPAEVLARHPGLHFNAALANVVTHHYAEAQRLLDAIRASQHPGERRSDLAMVRFNLVIWADRLDELRAALDEAAAVITPADGFMHPSMMNCTGYLGFLEGSDEMARSALAAAKASSHHRDNEVVRTYSEGIAAMAHLVRGELREARGIAGAELDRLAAAGRHYGTPAAIVAVVLADALYERDETTAARVLLDEHLEIAEDSCIPDLIIDAFVLRSRIARMEDDAARGDEIVGRLQRTGERRALPRLVASALIEKARVALSEGRTETATAHVREASLPALWQLPVFRGTFGNDTENPETALARLELFRGGTAAIAPLEAAIRAAESARRTRRAVKLRGLLAQALWLSGQRRLALRELQQALAAAAPEGLVRSLADEPWVLRDMIAAAPLADNAALAAFGQRVANACGTSPAAPRAKPAEAVREVLSKREIEVLAMLAHGMSNKEMARKLSRSEATVATHLRRIYEKLGAHTRTQAIAVARRGGLID
jgi:LuxR family maltose regulon positive regulatory protein